MPEGIGKAYEEWNIERIRKRAAVRRKFSAAKSTILGVLFGWAVPIIFLRGEILEVSQC